MKSLFSFLENGINPFWSCKLYDACIHLTFQATIKSIKFDGSPADGNLSLVFSTAPHGLAFDWVSRNLYWSDLLSGTIEVTRIDVQQHYRKVVLDNSGGQGVAKALSVVVDPVLGYRCYAIL